MYNRPQATASSLCTAFSWLVSYGVAAAVPLLDASLRPSISYFIFSSIAAAGTIFILAWVPETRAKSQTEIRDLFSRTPRDPMHGHDNQAIDRINDS